MGVLEIGALAQRGVVRVIRTSRVIDTEGIIGSNYLASSVCGESVP